MPRPVFFVIAVALWFGLHGYVGARLIKPLQARPWVRRTLWGVWGALALLAPLAMAARYLGLSDGVADVLNFAAYIQMGTFCLLLVASLLRDLGWLGLRGLDRLLPARRPAADAPPAEQVEGREPPPREGMLLPVDPSRRAFVQNILNAGVVSGVGALSIIGYQEARKSPPVKRVDVPIRDLHPDLDGLRIAQLSDLHIGPTLKADFLEDVVEATAKLKPDLIALTGDLLDGRVQDMAHEISALRRLSAPLGCWFVTGNHEYYWDAEAWLPEIERLGFKPLNNAHSLLNVRGASLMVAGVTDYGAGKMLPGHDSDPHKAVQGGEHADFKLLLAHQPKSVFEAARAGFDLQLSGHTHGGQFFPWNFVVGLVHPFAVGLNIYEDMQIYVSRGTGYWGPPMRLGAPSEITLLTLRRV